jgi:DNA (cytosine-5)-methyltransferase 1
MRKKCSPTLRAGVVPAAVALENHPTDSRVKNIRGRQCADADLPHGDRRQQCAACDEDPLRLRRRWQGRAHSGETNPRLCPATMTRRCSSLAILGRRADVSPTLTANRTQVETSGCRTRTTSPASFSPSASAPRIPTAMKSDNPHSGIYEAETARTALTATAAIPPATKAASPW